MLWTLKSCRSQVGIQIVLLYESQSARSPKGIYFIHSSPFPLHPSFSFSLSLCLLSSFLLPLLSFSLPFLSLSFFPSFRASLFTLADTSVQVKGGGGGSIQGRKCVGEENGNAMGPAATLFCFAGGLELGECFRRGSSVGISLSYSFCMVGDGTGRD